MASNSERKTNAGGAQRRTWDLEEYERRAKERADNGGEAVEGDVDDRPMRDREEFNVVCVRARVRTCVWCVVCGCVCARSRVWLPTPTPHPLPTRTHAHTYPLTQPHAHPHAHTHRPKRAQRDQLAQSTLSVMIYSHLYDLCGGKKKERDRPPPLPVLVIQNTPTHTHPSTHMRARIHAYMHQYPPPHHHHQSPVNTPT